MTIETCSQWVRLDENMCVACGLCYEIAPAVFKAGKVIRSVVHLNGYEQPAGRLVLNNELELVQEAAEECPSGAISVETVAG